MYQKWCEQKVYSHTSLETQCKISIIKNRLSYNKEELPYFLWKDLERDKIYSMEYDERFQYALNDEKAALFIFNHNELYTIFGYYDAKMLEFYGMSDTIDIKVIQHGLLTFSAEQVIALLKTHAQVEELFRETPRLAELLPPGYLETKLHESLNIPLGCSW